MKNFLLLFSFLLAVSFGAAGCNSKPKATITAQPRPNLTQQNPDPSTTTPTVATVSPTIPDSASLTAPSSIPLDIYTFEFKVEDTIQLINTIDDIDGLPDKKEFVFKITRAGAPVTNLHATMKKGAASSKIGSLEGVALKAAWHSNGIDFDFFMPKFISTYKLDGKNKVMKFEKNNAPNKPFKLVDVN